MNKRQRSEDNLGANSASVKNPRYSHSKSTTSDNNITNINSICEGKSDSIENVVIPIGWCVHKFGGSSLASADCYRNVCNIIVDHILKSPNKRICVVVSAMGIIKPDSHQARLHLSQLVKKNCINKLDKKSIAEGSTEIANVQPNCSIKQEKVTNLIIRCHSLAAKHDDSYLEILQSLKEKHITVVRDLFSGQENSDAMSEVESHLNKDFEDLRLVLRNTWLSRHIIDNHWSLGYGELWSARLMASYLNFKLSKKNAIFMDGRDVLHIFPDRAVVSLDTMTSLQKLRKWYSCNMKQDRNDVIVLTGYIASDSTGRPTTLGRDGSDYSASIMASLLNAEALTIWTDVDGVYSANPAIVDNARLQPTLSYDEASELAYFGAKVMHPRTMAPVIGQKIPIYLRNSFNPQHPGSCIQHISSSENEAYYGVIGLSYIPNLVLVSIEGCGMIAVPGVASRFFDSLAKKNVNVVMISQGGSEHSICCAVPLTDSDRCVATLRREFRDELEVGTVQNVEKSPLCACLAVVGDGMKRRRGVAGRMFCALGDAKISIIAIAQGSSERNISTIVLQKDAKKGLLAVHTAFLDEPKRSLVSPCTRGNKSFQKNLPSFSLDTDRKDKSIKQDEIEADLQTKYEEIKGKIQKLNEEANNIKSRLDSLNDKQ